VREVEASGEIELRLPGGVTAVVRAGTKPLPNVGYNSSANLSLTASVEALVRGVLEANARFFETNGLNIRVTNLDLVELYLDTAIPTVHELVRLRPVLEEAAAQYGIPPWTAASSSSTARTASMPALRGVLRRSRSDRSTSTRSRKTSVFRRLMCGVLPRARRPDCRSIEPERRSAVLRRLSQAAFASAGRPSEPSL
jgi:hypothetical protein